jgi:hypothetical protein
MAVAASGGGGSATGKNLMYAMFQQTCFILVKFALPEGDRQTAFLI